MSSILGLPEAFGLILLVIWVEIDRRIDKRSQEIRKDIAELRLRFD